MMMKGPILFCCAVILVLLATEFAGAREDIPSMMGEPLLTRRDGGDSFNSCSYNRGFRDGFKRGVQTAMEREIESAPSISLPA